LQHHLVEVGIRHGKRRSTRHGIGLLVIAPLLARGGGTESLAET